MCVVSMTGDYFGQRWPKIYPWVEPWVQPSASPYVPHGPVLPGSASPYPVQVDKAEFDRLKAEVELMKELMAKSKEYDARTGQKDCEIEDKIVLLRKIADLVGVDLNDVLPKKPVEEPVVVPV